LNVLKNSHRHYSSSVGVPPLTQLTDDELMMKETGKVKVNQSMNLK
jgi:hypothetical protein